MSPFDIAMLALLISFIIAILPGPSAMAPPAATDFAMFSLLHFIIAAEAGPAASTAKIEAVASRIFIGRFSLNQRQPHGLRLATLVSTRQSEKCCRTGNKKAGCEPTITPPRHGRT